MTFVHRLVSTPSRRTSCFSGLAVPGSDSGRNTPEISQTRISMATIHCTTLPCCRYWRTRMASGGARAQRCDRGHASAGTGTPGRHPDRTRMSIARQPDFHQRVVTRRPGTPSGWAARPRPLRTRPRLGSPGQIQHIPKMMKEKPVMAIQLRQSERMIQESRNHQRSMHLMPSRSQAADRRRWATFSLTAKT